MKSNVMRNIAIVTILLLPILVSGKDRIWSDDEIIDTLHRATQLRHFDFSVIRSCYNRIERDDTRIVSIAKEMYRRYASVPDRGIALDIISHYGGTNEIEFIESCVGDPIIAEDACLILMDKEGFTDRTLRSMERFWMHKDPSVYKASVYCRLSYKLKTEKINKETQVKTQDLLYKVFSNDVSAVILTVQCLEAIDPKFKQSKRKLQMLQFALPGIKNEYGRKRVLRELDVLLEMPALED